MPVYTLNVASQIRHQQTLMLCNVTLAQSSLLYSRRVGFSDIHPVCSHLDLCTGKTHIKVAAAQGNDIGISRSQIDAHFSAITTG